MRRDAQLSLFPWIERRDRARRLFAPTLRATRIGLRWLVGAPIALAAILIGVGNAWLSSDRDVPYRALDPKSEICRTALNSDLDLLARQTGEGVPRDGIGNDEWAALDLLGPKARPRFSCAIQRHLLPGYTAADGSRRDLTYDLAFVEFQEDGKPYLVRNLCAPEEGCRDEGYGGVRNGELSQLDALREHLKENSPDQDNPHYVIAFIHGWRHNAGIGDSNVGDLRHYAAHVARFVADRFGENDKRRPRVTALYIGWRGARTDETWLRRFVGGRCRHDDDSPIRRCLCWLGESIGTVSALPTLFDRKPVSEAIAPAALSALRSIERLLNIGEPLPHRDRLPASKKNRMIVFGHSLGGNMLATALRDDLLKKVERQHTMLAEKRQGGKGGSGPYMLPALGDLVVLINPASEATKWIAVQRAVWSRTAMSKSERADGPEYSAGHALFRVEQRPIVISVTAARDWPPSGRTEVDCTLGKVEQKGARLSQRIAETGVDYDWATYDLFPAFKGDFRPLADTLVRFGSGSDPHDECAVGTARGFFEDLLGKPAVLLGAGLRLLPFMRTDIEETRTIGHVDPPRPAQGKQGKDAFPTWPFGTTHELGETRIADASATPRKPTPPPAAASWLDPRRWFGEASQQKAPPVREVPVTYGEVRLPEAGCPSARGWLETARRRQHVRWENLGTGWTSDDVWAEKPALRFQHGFDAAGITPITRANDPFWNVRAFDTALARHDGYMLSSFICAMNQLVLDDITDFSPAPFNEKRLAPQLFDSAPMPTAEFRPMPSYPATWIVTQTTLVEHAAP